MSNRLEIAGWNSLAPEKPGEPTLPFSTHCYDPHTEACLYCGAARIDDDGTTRCEGGVRPRSWLLITVQGPAWVQTSATIPHRNILPGSK